MLLGATITRPWQIDTRVSRFGYVVAGRGARVVGSPLMLGMIWIHGQLMNRIVLSVDHFRAQASSTHFLRRLSDNWRIYLVDRRPPLAAGFCSVAALAGIVHAAS
jgi:hypothetical protein